MDESNHQNSEQKLNSINETPVIIPISEVQITETDTEISTEENLNSKIGETVSTTTNSGNNKKSTIPLILLFIFFFALIMGMPYLNDFIKDLKQDKGLSKIEQAAQEEEKKQQQQENKNQIPNKKEEITELVCTIQDDSNPYYSLTQIQKFHYNSKNQIVDSSIISQYEFSTINDDYESLKKQCDENSLKYISHEGYTMACSYNDSNIEIGHSFDLASFTPIIDGATNIQANANYQQDIHMMKENLTQQGYICE